MKTSITAAVFALSTIVAGAAGAATIQNGSFESQIVNGAFNTYDTNFNALDGWDVVDGTVDHIGSYWVSSDGEQSIDLVGNGGTGTIQTTVTGLEIGKSYSIFFDLAGNPGDVRSLLVEIGMTSGNFQFDASATSRTAMGWVTHSLDFIAGATSGLLSFTGSERNCCKGAALDNVRIVENTAPVPLPAGGVLLIGALGGLAAWRRRKS